MDSKLSKGTPLAVVLDATSAQAALDATNIQTDSACRYCGGAVQLGHVYCCHACEVLAQFKSENRTPGEAQESVKKTSLKFSYMDRNDFLDLFRYQNKEYHFLLRMEGLHCSTCVTLLEKLPLYVPAVVNARVNYGMSTLAIQTEPGFRASLLMECLEDMGYKGSFISPTLDHSTEVISDNRAALKRIAIAGFSAGNIMLFVIPVYAGLAGDLAKIFNWIGFALYLPILFYSAVPFYQGAWNALKYRTINVDLPITIAMLTSIAFSFFNLLRGDMNIYFDSTASFMFFILMARYLLQRTQQRYLINSDLQSFFHAEHYRRILPTGNWEVTIPSQLRISDEVIVEEGQTIPSDGRLESQVTTIDSSLFDGESIPRVYQKGMELLAGTKNLGAPIVLKVTQEIKHSRLGKLLQTLQTESIQDSPYISFTDRLAQYLLMTVFTIALVFFLIYAQFNLAEAFNRSLALLVLACPCALAFGTPLTLGMAVRKAHKARILLKSASILEKMLTIKNIFFDKTGTLTQGKLELLHTEPLLISSETQRIILSLERQSQHPIAFALRKAWFPLVGDLEVTNYKEVLGQGVSGRMNDDSYELKTLPETIHSNELGIELLRNAKSICRLYFADQEQASAKPLVRQLRASGYEIYLVSGDKDYRTIPFGKALGIPEKNIFPSCYPEDKLQILRSHQQTLMMGDGANDALALKAADVGIATSGSVDLSLQSAQVYMCEASLEKLPILIDLAKQTRRTLNRNLALSFSYNALGGLAALLGFISPMWAALLMPLSSALIILSTVWGMK